MFNNDMNNNRNFNNDEVKPLFQNDFTNTLGNANGEYQTFQNEINQPVQNTNNYQTGSYDTNNVFDKSFNTTMPQMNVNSAPSFVNQDLNLEGQNLGDIPPELGEIKNLSDATIASAPTMEVLDPMNVMPEVARANDPLDNYENGNLNNFNNVQTSIMPNPSINNSYPEVINQPQNYMSMNSFSNFDTSNGNFNLNNNNMLSSTPSSTFSGQIPNQLSQVPQFNNDQPAFNSNENFVLNTNSNFSVNENEFNQNNKNIVNNILGQENLNINQVSTEDNEITKELDNTTNTQSTDLGINNEYTIIQDSKLNDSSQNVSTLSDLGIEGMYDEPDTLDIMDINEDESDDDSKPMLSVNDSVLKLKELIQDLKNQGVDIELEEFDFEHMQQLIIKINK